MPARHAESSASRTTASHQQPPRATTTAGSVLPAELGLGEVQHELGFEVLWWLDDFGGFARGRGGGHGIGDGGERPQRPRRGEERGKGDGALRCGPLWAGHVSRICEGGRDGGTRRDDGGWRRAGERAASGRRAGKYIHMAVFCGMVRCRRGCWWCAGRSGTRRGRLAAETLGTTYKQPSCKSVGDGRLSPTFLPFQTRHQSKSV